MTTQHVRSWFAMSAMATVVPTPPATAMVAAPMVTSVAMILFVPGMMAEPKRIAVPAGLERES